MTGVGRGPVDVSLFFFAGMTTDARSGGLFTDGDLADRRSPGVYLSYKQPVEKVSSEPFQGLSKVSSNCTVEV